MNRSSVGLRFRQAAVVLFSSTVAIWQPKPILNILRLIDVCVSNRGRSFSSPNSDSNKRHPHMGWLVLVSFHDDYFFFLTYIHIYIYINKEEPIHLSRRPMIDKDLQLRTRRGVHSDAIGLSIGNFHMTFHSPKIDALLFFSPLHLRTSRAEVDDMQSASRSGVSGLEISNAIISPGLGAWLARCARGLNQHSI